MKTSLNRLLIKAYRRGHWRTSSKGKRYWVTGHITKQPPAKPEYVGYKEWKQAFLSNVKPANETLLKLFGEITWSGSDLGAYFQFIYRPPADYFERLNRAFDRKGGPLTGTTSARTDGRYLYWAKRWGDHVLLFRADLRGLYEQYIERNPNAMLRTRRFWRHAEQTMR